MVPQLAQPAAQRQRAALLRRRLRGGISDEPPADPNWIHEIRHDCFRILARRNGNDVRLYTRHGTYFADRFPRIVAAVKSLPVQSCFIDGEAILVDQRGLSAFESPGSRPNPNP
jgi:bifunctional non-homologous end joining protein LigD